MKMEIHIHVKAASMWCSHQLCVFLKKTVPCSLHDVIREWQLCFVLHYITPGKIQGPKNYITETPKKASISWCSNQERKDMLTTQNKDWQFAKLLHQITIVQSQLSSLDMLKLSARGCSESDTLILVWSNLNCKPLHLRTVGTTLKFEIFNIFPYNT